MENRHLRLAQALRDAGVTPSEAAERWGWSKDTLKSNLNGTIHFGAKGAAKYAERLRVRQEWLYYGTGPIREPTLNRDRAPIEVPLVSWVSAGQLAETGHEIMPEDDEYVLLAGLPRARYFATRVSGDSMDRFSPSGSIIIVNADEVDPHDGRAYVFSIRGETTYKVFRAEPVIRLEPYSTNPSHRPIYPDGQWSVVGRVVRSILDDITV